MENREIPNGAVTASSVRGLAHEPWQARLNNIETSGSTGSWSTGPTTVGQYLQIDLGKERVVNKIATQGRPSPVLFQWVTSYKLLFSSDGANWNEYQNDGVVKVSAVKVARSLAAWATILRSKTWSMSTGGNRSCVLLRQGELTRHGLKTLRIEGWGDCSLRRWLSWDVHSLLKALSGVWSSPSSEAWVYFPVGWFYLLLFGIQSTVGIGVRKGMVPSLSSEVALKMISFSAMWGDWTVCDDQVLIEDAKGSGVTVLCADKSHQFLIRYWRRSLVKKAPPSSETWVYFPAGCFNY